MSEPSSRALFDVYLSGDSRAAAEIYDRYLARLIGLVRKRLSSKLVRRVDPEDIVQSAYRSFFLRAREEQYVLDRAGDLWRLLVGITLKKLYGQVEWHTAARRSVGREEPVASAVVRALEPVAPQPTPVEEVALFEQLEQVMKQLSPLAARVVKLSLRGNTIEEIADAAQRSQRTIRRILDSVKQRFAADGFATRDLTTYRRLVPDSRATLSYSDFVLERLVGRGGVGRVYRATQRGSGKTVAVKALLKSRQTSAAAVEQFIQEAAILSRLDHPNIVRTLGLGQFPAGGYFLAMEYIDGENLQSRLERATFDAGGAIAVLRDVTRAVAYAHEQGVVHCDLKPANVLLDRTGRIVVSDFGFAQLLAGNPSSLQRACAIGGTAGYLAPELIRAKRPVVTQLADIYSLGALVHALLTGHPPTLRAPGGPDALSSAATMPASLHRLCSKCLNLDSAQRFQSANQILDELALIRDSCPDQNEVAQ
jgi:DNA-directed RNA polymerase specialized sigma24 family protein/predicted Ser/Thr protein kinase